MMVTHLLLYIVYLMLCQVANLALMVVSEDVAAFHYMIHEESAVHSRAHVAVYHAVVCLYYDNLSASVAILILANVGVCLTECSYCAKYHHTDDHHCLEC